MSFLRAKLTSDALPKGTPVRHVGFDAKDVTSVTETMSGSVRVQFKGNRQDVYLDENFEEIFNQIATAREKI